MRVRRGDDDLATPGYCNLQLIARELQVGGVGDQAQVVPRVQASRDIAGIIGSRQQQQVWFVCFEQLTNSIRRGERQIVVVGRIGVDVDLRRAILAQ